MLLLAAPTSAVVVVDDAQEEVLVDGDFFDPAPEAPLGTVMLLIGQVDLV